MTSSAILENFIHSNYPGVNLPPLWQVIYQEAIRGHHMLFRRSDVEMFDRETGNHEMAFDAGFDDDMEIMALKLISCADLQAMIKVVDALAVEERRSLYFMYSRVLWMWRNYVKEQLN